MILKKLTAKDIQKLVEILNEYSCIATASNNGIIKSIDGEVLIGNDQFKIDAKSLLGMYALVKSTNGDNIKLELDEFDSDKEMIELSKAISPFLNTKKALSL